MLTFIKQKTLLQVGASVAVLALTTQMLAADAAHAAPAQATGETSVEEVVITGTRLQPTGFQAPTPVTATSADDLKRAAPRNLADALTQLPTFNANTKSENPTTAATGGTNGQNLLNLRGLGPNRNLILLDGRRLVATNSSGSVDINVLPQGLVQRVDVVTGGASAAYGSDAVAGVVNFVLDTRFEGLKGEVQGGASTHNDLPSGQASLAYGRSFMDGRLHFVASAEFAAQSGLGPNDDTKRDWFEKAAGQLPNPAGGSPSVLVVSDIRNGVATYGGLITNTVLKGTQFLPGGATSTFTPGSIVGTTFQSGGDGARINIGFSPDQVRYNGFSHLEFELTPDISLFAEGVYAKSHVTSDNFVNLHTGSASQFTIFRDNAFLPAAMLTKMVSSNLQSFTMGRYERDFPVVQIETISDMQRLAFGSKGRISGDWKYDSYVTYGQTKQELRENNLTINRRLYAAVDAVVSPTTGKIVCRSTLSGLDAGCVPLNLFGEGAPSAEAIKYVTGDSVKYLTLQQTVAAVNFSGNLGETLNFGAGPIAVAFGGEYRKEKADQTVDALSPLVTDVTGIKGAPASQQGRPGSFNFFNPLPLSGDFDVKEAYGELGVPLLKDKPFVKALNMSLASRYADYSQSGGVTTWKYGLNYEVNDELRLRLTKSRDIRGPNILELFNSATQNSNNQIYKGKTTQALTISSGNPDLKPERATTLTYGVVYRPNYVPGLQASLDYYKISIDDAIGSLTAQQTLDQCAAGNQLLCSQFTVTAQNTLLIYTRQLNLSVQETAGYDFESAYKTEFMGGAASIRLLVNRSTLGYSQAPGSPKNTSLGTPNFPKWRGSLQARYAKDDWSVFLQERYISEALFDPDKVEGKDTNDNRAPAIGYTDITATYRLKLLGADQEAFFSVSNLFDQQPPVVTSNPTSFSSPTSTAYDRIGRYVSTGLRFKF